MAFDLIFRASLEMHKSLDAALHLRSMYGSLPEHALL